MPVAAQGFAHKKVEGGGNFYVLAVALNECDGNPRLLDHRGIIGKCRDVGLAIGTFEGTDVERLRGLHQSVFIARHGFASYLSKCFDNGRDGNDCRMGGSDIEAPPDGVTTHERTHTVMDAYDPFFIVGDGCQSVGHGMKARFATGNEDVVGIKPVLSAKVMPVCMLVGGQHEDDAQGRVAMAETVDGVHQDGFAVKLQKLFGSVGTHPRSLSSGDDDYIIHGVAGW